MDMPVEEANQEERIFLAVLRRVIPTTSRLDDGRLIKKIGEAKFKDACDELYGYIETGINSPLTKLEKDALVSKVIECLRLYMIQNLKITCTLKTLIDCFTLIPVSTDQSFPGYHDSKLLRWLF